MRGGSVARTVVVTGGAGFIGSHLVEALVKRGDNVRVLDNLSTGRIENLAALEGQFEFVVGDLRYLDTVLEVITGADAVLHQGALPSVPRSVKEPLISDAVNSGGTLNVLEAARRADVGRVVFASSSSVYGDSFELPKHEEMNPNPKSPYAVSKLTGEYYCRVFMHNYGLQTVPLRYFNVFGPRQDPTSQYSGVIAKFSVQALAGEPYPVFGDGQQARDFTYIDDVVEANLTALEAEGAPGPPMNVARGDRITLLELIAVLNRLVGKEIKAEFLPEREGDVRESQAAVERARERMGYEATVPFDEGMRQTLEWYQRAAG